MLGVYIMHRLLYSVRTRITSNLFYRSDSIYVLLPWFLRAYMRNRSANVTEKCWLTANVSNERCFEGFAIEGRRFQLTEMASIAKYIRETLWCLLYKRFMCKYLSLQTDSECWVIGVWLFCNEGSMQKVLQGYFLYGNISC